MEKFRSKQVWIPVVVVVGIPIAALAWWLGSPLLFDKTVEEEFPFAARAVVPKEMSRKDVEMTMATMAKMDSDSMDEPMPKPAEADATGEATALKSGGFEGVDSFHTGEGDATIYKLPDGSHVLRLAAFRVTNGPDLHLILTPNSNPQGRSDVKQQGYIDLGKLKGNIGNQNYPIPEGVDPASFNAAVIYCKPFHVIFSVAMLQ